MGTLFAFIKIWNKILWNFNLGLINKKKDSAYTFSIFCHLKSELSTSMKLTCFNNSDELCIGNYVYLSLYSFQQFIQFRYGWLTWVSCCLTVVKVEYETYRKINAPHCDFWYFWFLNQHFGLRSNQISQTCALTQSYIPQVL